MFVSKTDTVTSESNVTSFITSFTACSNSAISPSTTRVSSVSIKLNEKLKQDYFSYLLGKIKFSFHYHFEL